MDLDEYKYTIFKFPDTCKMIIVHKDDPVAKFLKKTIQISELQYVDSMEYYIVNYDMFCRNKDLMAYIQDIPPRREPTNLQSPEMTSLQNLPAKEFGDTITSMECLTDSQKAQLYRKIFGKSCNLLTAVQEEHICFDEIERALSELYPKEDTAYLLHKLKKENYGPYSYDPGSAKIALFTEHHELTPLGLDVLRKLNTKARLVFIHTLDQYHKRSGRGPDIDFSLLNDTDLLLQFAKKGYSVHQVSKIICDSAQ